MTPPTMAGWNLALRFGLELGALAGMGFAAWTFTSGPARWVAATLAPVTAAIIWGVFNVLDDPSRSGAAPVEVSGWVRLAIELLVLGGGAAAFAFAGRRNIAIAFALLIVFHYAASSNRIEWLIQSDGDSAIGSSGSL
ncbi:MAG: YrdB family protein [Acidimicrobiia bacterium]|nr:YrdB family protein [Acidimicrobiia bacterium]MDH5519446.1 YrdB family protein [Acidimicrobiia bacterium]